MIKLKQLVFDKCVNVLNEKIVELKQSLQELTEGAQNDSKSSAGDKHETSRAMVQLEQEKLGKQLSEIETQQQILEKIDVQKIHSSISLGSLVETNRGYLFIAIALGKVNVEGKDIMVISPQSPLGMKLIGRIVNDTISINNINYLVSEIW